MEAAAADRSFGMSPEETLAFARGDAAVWERYDNRVRGYLTAFVRRFYPALYDEAEDLVQATFVKFLLQARRVSTQYDPHRGPLRPWLVELTRWTALQRLRRQHRDGPADVDAEDVARAPEPYQTPAGDPLFAQFTEACATAIGSLRPSQRRAFELELLLGDYEYVAKLLGLDPAGVASQVSRSRKAIREFLEARGFVVVPLGAPLPKDAKTVTTLTRETIIYRTPGGTDERR